MATIGAFSPPSAATTNTTAHLVLDVLKVDAGATYQVAATAIVRIVQSQSGGHSQYITGTSIVEVT